MYEMMKNARAVLLVALVLLLPSVLCAQEAPPRLIDLAPVSGYFFNADPSLTIDQVSSPEMRSKFTPVDGRSIWTGKHASASWLSFTIPSDRLGPGYGPGSKPEDRETQWLLIVQPSFSIILDNVQFYVPRADGGFDRFETGALVKSNPSAPHSRFFYFDLPPAAFNGATCYLRISSTTDVLMTIGLASAVSFARSQAQTNLGYGLIFGIIVAMIFYSLFLLMSLHYRSYLYYILYCLTVGLWIFYVQGFAKVLFGQMPGFDQAMLWLWAGQFITWGTIFTISFLDLKKTDRVLFYIMAIPAALGGIVSLAGILGFDGIAFSLSHILGLVVPVLVMVAAGVRLSRGFKSALYYLIAWFFLALGGVIFALMGLKVLPVLPITTNALPIGIALESVFLAMALADRFKHLEEENKKLEATQAHFKELSLTDTLTGLRNRRFLMQELDRAIKHSEQSGEPLSVIMLDIDNFKHVNDRFGHEVGDDILVSLLHSIRSCTRPSDPACLYGGDEVVIFMPRINKDQALSVAERIRAHFEVESLRVIRGISLGATISSGVVEYQRGESLDNLFSRADTAMYQAKSQGKNCSVLA